jgi:hypothetical protein
MGVTRKIRLRGERLIWRAELRPAPLSRAYLIELIYRSGKAPRVHVLSPDLRAEAEGVERLPHVYAEDVLCLCYPEQWNDGKLLARTIVPWISEWLLFYELWKVDGIWRGGGHEPAVLGAAA